MKNINIYFCDFWKGFTPDQNLFVAAIESTGYKPVIQQLPDNDTDLIICSCFGNEHLKYVNCKKIIYYSGENDFPTYLDYDYAVTHNTLNYERHLRIPLWVWYNYDYICKHGSGIEELQPVNESYFDRKFCADVISNTQVAWQARFKLSDQISEKYKELDHGGSYKNNVGGKVGDKHNFFTNYKFTMASENSMVDGYITEKIFDGFITRTIPIYLGSNYVINDFNKNAFINVNDYKTFDDLINRIKEIDTDKELYLKMLNTNPLAEDKLYSKFVGKLSGFLTDIIEHGTIRCHKYGRIGIINSRR